MRCPSDGDVRQVGLLPSNPGVKGNSGYYESSPQDGNDIEMVRPLLPWNTVFVIWTTVSPIFAENPGCHVVDNTIAL
jgi:hypothetical protein